MRTVVMLAVCAGLALGQKGVTPEQGFQDFQDDLRKVGQAKLQELKAQVAATEARIAELRVRYSDSYPDLRSLLLKLAALQLEVSKASHMLADLSGTKTVLPDQWWRNAVTAQLVGLTADQQKKMDDVFQQYKLKLIDLNATLQKEELMLEPLVSAEPLDEGKITGQIDRVAQARAELEKANGRMLLGIRKLLTPDQWSKLNAGFSLMPGKKGLK